jgi:hypothetical protein
MSARRISAGASVIRRTALAIRVHGETLLRSGIASPPRRHPVTERQMCSRLHRGRSLTSIFPELCPANAILRRGMTAARADAA